MRGSEEGRRKTKKSVFADRKINNEKCWCWVCFYLPRVSLFLLSLDFAYISILVQLLMLLFLNSNERKIEKYLLLSFTGGYKAHSPALFNSVYIFLRDGECCKSRVVLMWWASDEVLWGIFWGDFEGLKVHRSDKFYFFKDPGTVFFNIYLDFQKFEIF